MENPGWEFRTILSDINSGGPEKEPPLRYTVIYCYFSISEILRWMNSVRFCP